MRRPPQAAPAIRGHTAVRPARGSAWFRLPQLSAVDYAAARGGRIVALTALDSRHFRVNFNTGYILDSLPGRDKLMSSSREEKLAVLRDPAQRAELNRLAARAAPRYNERLRSTRRRSTGPGARRACRCGCTARASERAVTPGIRPPPPVAVAPSAHAQHHRKQRRTPARHRIIQACRSRWRPASANAAPTAVPRLPVDPTANYDVTAGGGAAGPSPTPSTAGPIPCQSLRPPIYNRLSAHTEQPSGRSGSGATLEVSSVRRPMRAGQMNTHFTNISWCSLNPGLAGRSRASRTRPSSGLADCLLGKRRSLIVQQVCSATPFSASAGRQSATARGEANQRLAFRTPLGRWQRWSPGLVAMHSPSTVRSLRSSHRSGGDPLRATIPAQGARSKLSQPVACWIYGLLDRYPIHSRSPSDALCLGRLRWHLLIRR